MAIPTVTPYSGNKPTPGQDQVTFNKNMSDELDYFNALPEELNPAIVEINNSVTATGTARDEAQLAAVAATASANYQGLFEVGVTNASAGESYSYDSSIWLCVTSTTETPSPESSNWQRIADVESIAKSQEQNLGSGAKIYPREPWLSIQAGSAIPAIYDGSNITHIRYNGIVLAVWDASFKGLAHVVATVTANSLGGYDVVTDQGTYEFVTLGNDQLRRDGDIRGWGVNVDAEYGVDLTDSSTSFIAALANVNRVSCPAGNYLLGASQIAIGENQSIEFAGRELSTIYVTANSGSTDKSLSPFTLTSYSKLIGYKLIYPNQAIDENDVNTILSYPPFVSLVNSDAATSCVAATLEDVHLVNVYTFIDQSNSAGFGRLSINRVIGNVGYRFAKFSGHMGNTSFGNDISVTVALGNWGSATEVWTRTNAGGLDFYPSGGSVRIDGFLFENLSLIGGAFSISGANETWLQINNYQFDIATQAIIGGFGYLQLGGTGFMSAQDNTIAHKSHKPVIEMTDGTLIMDNSRIGIQAAGAGCAIYNPNGIVNISNTRLESSRGYITPAIVCPNASVSNCRIKTSVEDRKLTFADIAAYNPNKVIVDGIDSWDRVTTSDLNGLLPNIDMSSWTAGEPDTWTNTSGSFSTYVTEVAGGGMLVSPPNGTNPSLTMFYDLANIYEYFGHFYITTKITLSNPLGLTANNGTLDFYIGNDTDGWNKANNVMGNGETSSECSGIPLDSSLLVSLYLPVPLLKTADMKLKIVINYLNSTNHIAFKIEDIQIWKCNAGTGSRAAESSAFGTEFTYGGNKTIRDMLRPDGTHLLRRLHEPTTDLHVAGDSWRQVSPTLSGEIGGDCSITGSPGTWYSLGNYS